MNVEVKKGLEAKSSVRLNFYGDAKWSLDERYALRAFESHAVEGDKLFRGGGVGTLPPTLAGFAVGSPKGVRADSEFTHIVQL